MTDIDILLNQSNPNYLAKKIAENSKNKRIKSNFTQHELSERSGVSLSSLKRFEQKAEISLASLLKIAIALDATEMLMNLFTENQATSLDDYIKENTHTKKQRVRKRKRK
ncbi:MAG: XRE family transcriptional regulator [Bacteroidetes bacterium]|nr:MAG: XRE family transcriptional regulator [Bacteroidota bacterium]